MTRREKRKKKSKRCHNERETLIFKWHRWDVERKNVKNRQKTGFDMMNDRRVNDAKSDTNLPSSSTESSHSRHSGTHQTIHFTFNDSHFH